MTERFTAFTDCPKCGRIDCHRLRSPVPSGRRLTEERVRKLEEEIEGFSRGGDHDRLILLLEQLSGLRSRHDRYMAHHAWVSMRNPLALVDEDDFEVIRICTACGHEFGQI